MGQPITVVEKPSSRPGVIRFEINRSITGMGHEHYRSLADATGDRPADRLARVLLEYPGVQGVHVNSNIITLDVRGSSTAGLKEAIESLFLYYRPGVEVQMVDD